MSESIIRVTKQKKGYPGIYGVDLDLHIARATSCYTWLGPKIPAGVWNEILAFFKWTYDTSRSESQVRLFVNGVTKEWAAWAFPQERGTGMTTKELTEHPNWDTQRRQFPDPDWLYYGTVHHHCSVSAFQSGTDLANEENQDGLHITVGKLSSDRYDIDARLYQSGWKLPLDLSTYWDVGDVVRSMVPSCHHDSVARFQMTEPAPAEATFPDAWRENYMIPPTPPVPQSSGVTHGPYTPTFVGSGGSKGNGYYGERKFDSNGQRVPPDTNFDQREAAFALHKWCDKNPVRVSDQIWEGTQVMEAHEMALSILNALAESPLATEICRLLWVNDLSPDKLAGAFDEECAEQALQEMQGLKKGDTTSQEEDPKENDNLGSGVGSAGEEWKQQFPHIQ